MNFLVGLLFGYLLGEKTGGLIPSLPGGGGGGGLPPFPLPNFPPSPAPSKKPPVNNTGLPGGNLLPGIIPASWPWGTPAPAGSEPPAEGGVPWVAPTPSAPPAPVARTYTIRDGDYGSGLAKRATGDAGRWRELLAANPELSTYTDAKGATQIKPWKIGQKIVVPAGWNL